MDSNVFSNPLFYLFIFVGLAIGAVGGWFLTYKLVPNNAKKKAENIIKDAEVKGSQIIKTAQIDGRSAALELKVAAEKEAKERKDEVLEIEKKLVNREQQIDVREMTLSQKEEQLKEKNQQLDNKNSELDKKQEVLQEKIDSIIVELQNVAKIKAEGLQFSGVYGIPRGGLIPATLLSYKLGIPLLMGPAKNCLIVDDIADSGKTLMHFTMNDTQFNKYFIATIYYAKRSLVKPDFYTKEKDGKWIEFPWEKNEIR